jgi:hypothetical protein
MFSFSCAVFGLVSPCALFGLVSTFAVFVWFRFCAVFGSVSNCVLFGLVSTFAVVYVCFSFELHLVWLPLRYIWFCEIS